VTVTVQTDQGTATTPFHYYALFAVDGDNLYGTGGDLYVIDPVNVVSGYWSTPNDGTNGYNFDGIAFDSTGVLYGVTTGNGAGDANGAQLMTVDFNTGTVTPVGDLVDGAGKHYYVTDIKFSGTTLSTAPVSCTSPRTARVRTRRTAPPASSTRPTRPPAR
jgi:hypothetical protein